MFADRGPDGIRVLNEEKTNNLDETRWKLFFHESIYFNAYLDRHLRSPQSRFSPARLGLLDVLSLT